jgi:uncharacterized protein YdaU (DUF1376 family)
MSGPKIRRVDFSPDEYIAGVNGMRAEEQGVYWMICALIYSRGEPVENDAQWIGRAAGCTPPFCRKLIDGLIARGKLALDESGRLTNARAERELTKAAKRVHDASTASARGVDARRTRSRREHVSGKIKDLAEPGGAEPSTINHQRPKKDSEALAGASARARAGELPLDDPSTPAANGEDHGKRYRLPEGWRPTTDQRRFAEAEGLDADAVADAFTVYWTEGKGRREQRTDDGWAKTWRGWCRRDAERSSVGTAQKNRAPDRPARGGGLVGAALRLRARNNGS